MKLSINLILKYFFLRKTNHNKRMKTNNKIKILKIIMLINKITKKVKNLAIFLNNKIIMQNNRIIHQIKKKLIWMNTKM